MQSHIALAYCFRLSSPISGLYRPPLARKTQSHNHISQARVNVWLINRRNQKEFLFNSINTKIWNPQKKNQSAQMKTDLWIIWFAASGVCVTVAGLNTSNQFLVAHCCCFRKLPRSGKNWASRIKSFWKSVCRRFSTRLEYSIPSLRRYAPKTR